MISISLLALVSFFVALFLTPAVRDLALDRGWVDVPDHGQAGWRKLHRVPIPRLGGVAVFVAYGVSFLALIALPLTGGRMVEQELGLVARLSPAVLVIFVVGLLDDIWGLPAWQKLIGQLAAASAANAAGVTLLSFGGHVLPVWAQLPLTLVWLVLLTNAINLIDGMDGLATGVGLFAALTMFTSALLAGNVPLAMATVPLAGALLGFLRYNFNPATIFLGDCGSLLIGFLLGCYGLIWSQKSATLLGVTAPLLALAIPLLDVFLAIVRRFLKRQSIFGADRGHIHHRLLDRGLTVRQAALLLYGVALLFAILSLISSVTQDSYAGLILVLFCAVTWIGVQGLGYVELNMAGRLLIGGGFRRLLLGQLALRSYQESMKKAAGPREAWEIVQETAREMGFHRVAWHVAGTAWEARVLDEVSGAEWTAELPLRNGDWVRLSRPFDSTVHQSAMGPFLDTLRGTLMEKSKSWEGGGDRKLAAGA
jgi:UDP-GlcNAc:undecaprenyl-phosphate/decaprenyl-phosphate GlcNAc-1-phosphate transferase